MSNEEPIQLFTRLLVQEAWLRDNDRYEEWLDFFADECRYWAPIRNFMVRGEEDFNQPDRMHHIDEDKPGLALRIKRLSSGMTFTEEPPARTRRMISNVQVLESDEKSAVVLSYFMMFRSHPGHKDTTAVGYRRDRWTNTARGWKIAERMIVLDHDRLESYLTLL